MNDANSPIIVTGGAQRLGLAVALALDKSRFPVVITYRKTRPLLSKLEQQGIGAIQADFSSENGVNNLAETLRKRYSSLRAIMHNASEWLPEGNDLRDSTVIKRMLSVHVTAPYLLNQACGTLLRRHGELHGYADIIHMSDYVASTGSEKHIAYAASKAAMHNLTLSFARKYAPLVKVNSIAPALLMFHKNDNLAYREKARKKSLLGIVPGESEGVNAVRYVLDSRYLTGKTIAIDGGRHLAQAS